MPHALTIKTAPLPGKPTGVLVLYAGEGEAPAGAGAAIWTATGLDWNRVSDAAGFTGKQGQVLDLIAPPGVSVRRLVVLGRGKLSTNTVSTTAWTDRGGSLAAKLAGFRAKTAAIILDEAEATPQAVAELAAGLKLRHYRFDKYKTKKKDNTDVALTVTLHVRDRAKVDTALAYRAASADGTILARQLVNEPPNALGPVEFAREAQRLTKFGVTVEVLDPQTMKKLGMGALLAVAQGSSRPARLVVLQWKGGKTGDAPCAFVGKGVVFDTGGISIKPAASMEDMKGDMGGAAAVTGLMHALAARKAKVNAVGILGLVENMPDGNAMRPGDILTAMSGKTIEVVNTDAEGRLVLADALWYAQQRFKPKFLIDLATLTGAISVALGQDHAGMFTNNDELATKLIAAGLASGEKLWRMPLSPAYEKLIESRFADIKNSGGRLAGSSTAAHFLQHFVNNVPWAHLDIAGMAFGGTANETNHSWASGFGVALLERLIRDNYEG
jgi:leucyl aminopeptidase